MDIGYWKLKDEMDFDTDSVKWTFDAQGFAKNIYQQMMDHEEKATLHLVLTWLRGEGYTIIEPEKDE